MMIGLLSNVNTYNVYFSFEVMVKGKLEAKLLHIFGDTRLSNEPYYSIKCVERYFPLEFVKLNYICLGMTRFKIILKKIVRTIFYYSDT